MIKFGLVTKGTAVITDNVKQDLGSFPIHKLNEIWFHVVIIVLNELFFKPKYVQSSKFLTYARTR